MAKAIRFLGAGALACVLLGGCVKDVTLRGRQQLAVCYDAYARGNDREAIQLASAFLRDNSPSVRDDEAYYMRGLALSRQGDPIDARADFDRAARSERPAVRARATLALGDLALTAGKLDRAEAFYRRSLAEAPPDKTPAQHAGVRLAHVLQKSGRWSEADVQYSRIIHHFEGTKYERWASGRIHGRAWTVRVGAFSRRQGAAARAAGLVKSKLPAVVDTRMLDGKVMHVVCVGRYKRYDQAAATLAAVRKLHKDAYISVAK